MQATCSCRYLRNITIPAVFIKKTEGQVLKDLLKPDMEDVYVVMDWNDVLPRADKARCSGSCYDVYFLRVLCARDCVLHSYKKNSWWQSLPCKAITAALHQLHRTSAAPCGR